MLLSVIIPAYNEEKAIHLAVSSVYDFFSKKMDWTVEVIVVDDCSSDKTSEIVHKLKEKYPTLNYLRNDKNMGKGFSINKGVIESKGDFILFTDADSSTNIDQFDVLWDNIDNNDIVIGSRALVNSKILAHQIWIKEFVAKCGNKFIRLVLRLPIKDTQCGFKLFSKKAKEIFQLQTIDRWGFDMEIIFIAKKKGFNIKEVPVVWTNDFSSLVKPRDYFIVFLDIFKIILNDFLGKYNKK